MNDAERPGLGAFGQKGAALLRPQLNFTESQNHLGRKRPLRSSSPASGFRAKQLQWQFQSSVAEGSDSVCPGDLIWLPENSAIEVNKSEFTFCAVFVSFPQTLHGSSEDGPSPAFLAPGLLENSGA